MNSAHIHAKQKSNCLPQVWNTVFGVLLLQIRCWGASFVKRSRSRSPCMKLKLHLALLFLRMVGRTVNKGPSMRVPLARKDAGRPQQMPMFVQKCANIHKHIFQKAYFRKWRHEEQFCAKLNGPQISGMKLNARGSKCSLAAFGTAKCCKHGFYYTRIASKCQRLSPKNKKNSI